MAAYYASNLTDFRTTTSNEIVGELAAANVQKLLTQQTRAWQVQIEYLQHQRPPELDGNIFFKFVILHGSKSTGPRRRMAWRGL